MTSRTAVLLALAAALPGCFEAEGEVLGPITDEQLGELAPGCFFPCDTAADCGPFPHLCSDGRCVPVGCVDDSDCPGVFQLGSTCHANYCGDACAADTDCPDPREVCRDGFCFKPPETPPPPCTSDAECGPDRRRVCRGNLGWNVDVGILGNPDAACFCAPDGSCREVECRTPADCAAQFFSGPEQDAARWSCDGGLCAYLGCSSDADCDFGTCDRATGLCGFGSCASDLACGSPAEAFFPHVENGALTCVGGACAYAETCDGHEDCTARGRGSCRIGRGAAEGHCTYYEDWFLECRSDDDCPPFLFCRASGYCDRYGNELDPEAAGAPCDDVRSCDARYFSQSVIADIPPEGQAAATNVGCYDTPDAFGGWEYRRCDPATSAECGPGYSCVGGETAYGPTGVRSLCLPNQCLEAGGCPASLAECAEDADCPGRERCAFPVYRCSGVCLDLDCEACASWLAPLQRRACLTSAVEIQVIRQD